MKRKRLRLMEGAGGEDGEQESVTGGLSDDTLLYIFGLIPTRSLLMGAGLVCRRWSRLALSQVQEIVSPVIGSGKKISKVELFSLLDAHCSTIHSVDFNTLKELKDRELNTYITMLRNLRHLSVFTSKSFVEKLLHLLPKGLESLSLRTPEPTSADSFCFFSLLHQQCPRITSLVLDSPTVASEKCISVMLDKFPALTFLEISSSVIGWEEVYAIFACCTRLTSLSLMSAKLVASSVPTPGRSFPPSLLSLRLFTHQYRAINFASSKAVNLFKHGGLQLKALHAHSSFSASWQAITAYCHNLKVLDLSTIKLADNKLTQHEEGVLYKLPSVLRKLERVCLPMGTDKILALFGRACPQLLEFRFQGVGNGKQTFPVTDWGVSSLVEGCPRLEVLSLESCDKLTVSATRSIAFNCGNLKVLHLGGCKLVDDHAISVLFPRLSNTLRLLDINGCAVTVSTLSMIQSASSSLRVLTIHQPLYRQRPCQAVIKELKQQCPHLCIKTGPPYVWNGLYHAPNFDDL